MSRWALLLLLAATCTVSGTIAAVHAQGAAASGGVAAVLDGLRLGLSAGDATGLFPLIAQDAPPEVREFAASVVVEGDVVRAAALERDRQPLEGVPAGAGHSLIVELFTETSDRAQIVTARLDVARAGGGEPDGWQIVDAEELARVDRLFRLRVNRATQYAARALTIRGEDLELTLPSGTVFEVTSAEGITGLILIGRGTMRFSPAPDAERRQLAIFGGGEVLDAEFESAFVRFSPRQYEQAAESALQPVPVSAALLQTAEAIFAEEAPKTYSLDLADLSDDVWYLLPPPSDFVAEVRTRRYSTLTYTRTMAQSEDISFFNRADGITIALYASPEKLASRGAFYSEDTIAEYDVIDYELDARIRYITGLRAPQYPYIEGSARLVLRARMDGLASFPLRLDDELRVTEIASREHGGLLSMRVRGRSSVVVTLPTSLPRGAELTLLVRYEGPLRDENLDNYAAIRGDISLAARERRPDQFFPFYPPEQNLLLSSRSSWYPQSPASDYTTATLRITVPDGYGVVASGVPLGEVAAGTYLFSAPSPIRYFSAIVTRLRPAGGMRVPMASDTDQAGGTADAVGINLTVDASPRQQGEGRVLLAQAEDIIRFYVGLLGRYPYESLALALVESGLPGGHSPGYAVMLNNPVPDSPYVWRNDPSSFDGYPEFFLAHEIAHQWWGQAVGWKNYHEQWLSEGFAQYFAALYARHAHGEATFVDMLRRFHRWSAQQSDQGPIHLGYRLGHIQRDARIFRGLVYNKSAAVLHMLRRLIGDEAFFAGLRRFYGEYEFQKAGTDDLRRVLEEVSGRPLERFFERWIYGDRLPRVRYRVAEGQGRIAVRFEQDGDAIYDVPVTVSVIYANGATQDVGIPLTDRVVDREIATSGPVRQVQVNGDFAALGEFVAR
ncbi:MAG: hypothetical protein HY657_08450 [Acidobacteria bacterium]|nr:hypothetical protein [Acidobacteriota bacterium]